MASFLEKNWPVTVALLNLNTVTGGSHIMVKQRRDLIIIGALLGAVAGAMAAVILVQRAEEAQQSPKLTAGDGVKVGLGVLGLLRLISEIGSKK